MRNLFIIASFLFLTIVSAEDSTVARIERRPLNQANLQHGQFNQPYHPVERQAARQDVNRAEETNALNNAANNAGGVQQAVPVYPNGTVPTNSGNSVNINTTPQ